MPACLLACPPDLAALRAAQPDCFPLLLESSGSSGWDLLFFSPDPVRTCPLAEAPAFWQAFDDAWQSRQILAADPACAALPFTGGWIYFLGYELLHSLEPRVRLRDWPEAFPVAALARSPGAVLIDREHGCGWLVAESQHWLTRLQQRLVAIARGDRPRLPVLGPLAVAEDDPVQFLDGVKRIKHYIREGDVFQVNLSRGWQIRLDAGHSADRVYADLRQANPAPFSGLFDLGRWQIVSSSPERLLQVRAGRALTRPIAGTHPRSADEAEDAALRARLAASTKERAEHVMLIDLERNDLGRICQPGSVRVDELMAVTSYRYVHHIESTVSGQLREAISPVQALRAMFPGGTITGCPKVRTMQIISELETAPRNAYTGSLGYLNHDGSLDSNILIRSFMQQGDRLWFRAGAGIVADSDPERELQETRAKARGLLRALGLAG